MTFAEFYDGTKERPGAYLLNERHIAEGAWNRAVCEVGFRLDAVRKLHVSDKAETPFCNECGHAWPCLTIRAVDEEMS